MKNLFVLTFMAVLLFFSQTAAAQTLSDNTPQGNTGTFNNAQKPTFIFRRNQMEFSFDTTNNIYQPIYINPVYPHTDHVPFTFSIAAVSQLPYTGRNNTMMWGWNIGAGGGQIVPGRPGIGYSLESNYHPDNDTVTTFVESHEFYLTPQGRQIRLKSYTINTKEDGMIDFYHTVDRLYLKSKKNGFHTPVSMSILNDSLGSLSIMGLCKDNKLLEYSITATQPGVLSIGATSGKQGQLDLSHFNSIKMGGLEYNNVENYLANAHTYGNTRHIRNTLLQEHGFFFNNADAVPAMKYGVDYNTGESFLNANLGYYLTLGGQAVKLLRLDAAGVRIGDAQPPNPAAVLDINSTTKGLLIPRMTMAQRNGLTSLTAGLELYCFDCVANDGSVGVKQTYNGEVFKNHW